MQSIAELKQLLDVYFLGWPIIIWTLAVGIFCTIILNFIQIRYFFTSLGLVLKPAPREAEMQGGNVTPIQAFINTLSANIGNGSLAGMATAIAAGGPGAAFWVVVIGIIMMSVRFAEVFLSTHFGAQQRAGVSGLGGPMLYLRAVPGGHVLSKLYAAGVLILALSMGNALQTNTMGLSLQTTWGIQPEVTAVIVFIFLLYIVTGGAQRISKASEAIVPLKVGVFFVSSFIILGYHWSQIVPALGLIWSGAFQPLSVAGGLLGFTVQQAMRFGISRAIFATESGLGTAAILFGFTGSQTPISDAVLSMLSAFISTLVCFVVALCIIVSGAWTSGATSSALTILAYQTVFGWLGGWIVSFLSIAFGMGVIVAFAYIAKESWLFLTGGRYGRVLDVLYCLFAGGGALVAVSVVWYMAEIINAILLIINLVGIVYLIPVVKHGVRAFKAYQPK
jgi:AGCS family alanine or glycine:cation symporter